MSLAITLLSYLPKPIRDHIMDKRIPPTTNSPAKVQLSRISHVYFSHPDLARFAAFAHDFGLVETHRATVPGLGERVYYRGYGRDPYVYVATQSSAGDGGKPRFGGAAFVVASREEFEKAAKMEGANRMSLEKEGAPGGGEMITFHRPDSTFFHVVFGQTEREVEAQGRMTATHEETGPLNTAFEKPRKGRFQRYHPGPALVHKLGHYGYVVPDFDAELAWYLNNFNFMPSDVLHHPDFANLDVLVFIRLDLGEEWSDHHSFFMQRAPPEVPKTYLHHTSFEVDDFDTQLIGHDWLAKKGWKSIWGVGRHVLGSQIFDYWADPSGFKIEHYADGDLVNETIPTKRDVVGPFSVWGPEVPKDFGNKSEIA